MCSNTSSSGGGATGSRGGGDGEYGSLILTKSKRQRVPKRGPGVAELEKILREQESINSLAKDNNNNVEGFSSSRISPFSNSYHPQNISDHNNHFGPPAPHVTMLYGNGGKSAVLGGGNGGRTGGSSMVLPEQGLFPAMWSSSCDQSSMYGESPKFLAAHPLSGNGSDHMYHFPIMFQKKPCSPSMKSLFPQSGPLSSSDNTSAGFYLHLEPPSNQRSHQNLTSILPAEEEKIFGMKQSRTFFVDNTSDHPFHFQVYPHFSQLNMPDKSASCDNLAAFNLKQNKTFSWDHSKHGGHFHIFGSTPTPPHSQTSPFQETSETSNQVSSWQGGTVQKKPFFSFLIPEEHTGGEAETALTLNNERGRMRGEAIDLNLKL